MKKNTKYLLIKSAEYERKVNLYCNNKLIKKAEIATATIVSVVISICMASSMAMNVINNNLEVGHSNEDMPIQLDRVINYLGGVISEYETDTTFAPYKAKCKDYLQACINAKETYPLITDNKGDNNPKKIVNFEKFMIAAETIANDSAYVIGAVGKLRGFWRDSILEGVNMILPINVANWLESNYVSAGKAVGWLQGQMALILPDLQEKFKKAKEIAAKEMEKIKRGEGATTPTTKPATGENEPAAGKGDGLEDLAKAMGK